ncbi:MAG: bifunctional diaminohydroxyphosphoribosylaminopyrimidine deaminase/5-amino-6-(5-phosphoribosylamino)uracil reductase RibD [Chloroflexi bacterium]|nr:bifunctional diaminohydroxyphosphoribosylaminopyrimidine deaminase/5-amino-6-(5-phosphoribosylamino)uracil reductase RibD [Chloroflexota bacterium]
MDYMSRALDLAGQALGTTSPNPAVGAVLVKEGQVVGEGFTQAPGEAHAEIMALHQAGELARSATLYVTLEPCSHQGRTPPCTSAIVAAGVAEVHTALLDPNPLINGRGRKELEEAGISVAVGEREEEARQVNEAYLKFTRTGLPFVTAKYAASLDGKIATRTGDARWITGVTARRRANQLRAASDVVMVGIGTVLADDPLLTARDDQDHPLPHQPLRVIVDSSGRTPATARLFQEPGQVLIAGSRISPRRAGALKGAGAEVLELPAMDGSVDLRALMAALGQRQATAVLVEGGGRLLGSVLGLGLADKVVVFLAPVIIGGAEAVPAVGGVGSGTVGEALRLADVSVEQVGEDLMVVGYPAW